MNINLDGSTGAWLWLAGGILLCAAETFAPGLFLIWLGLAAIVTGLVYFVLPPLGFDWTLLLFCALAVISVLIGRRIYGSAVKASPIPFLNRRAEGLVGRVFVLDEPIREGRGRVRVEDSVWRVKGPDLEAGESVKVTGVEGGVLLIVAPV